MRKKKLSVSLAVGAVLVGGLFWANSALETTCFGIFSPHIPAGFEGFRIAQVSDLHNTEFGRDNEKLLSMLKESDPDIIVLTGDLIDNRNLKLPVALSFAEKAAKIAPCYFVTGNHESRIAELPALLEGLTYAGVTVLRDERISLERNGDTVTLIGLDDPAFRSDYMVGDSGPVLTEALTRLVTPDMGYTVLLSHRPEWFHLYSSFGIDLVFSGHAHGGQFRLPFVGGVIAPNQWFFPEFDAGVYTEGTTSMVVSRGLGPSIIPLRINNRPELVLTVLYRQEEQ